jgi:hypothetical protein
MTLASVDMMRISIIAEVSCAVSLYVEDYILSAQFPATISVINDEYLHAQCKKKNISVTFKTINSYEPNPASV